MASEPPGITTAELLRDPERLLTIEELSQIVSVPLSSVRQWATSGKGPRRMHVGRYVRYRAGDVRQWLDELYVD